MTPAAGAPSLVVLAAGLGSRYHGTKQVEGVGPDGEWLLEYAVHDALAAGFRKIVLVIRAGLRKILQHRLAPRVRGRALLRFVEQRLDALPEGCSIAPDRQKPLGTGHALWCCAPELDGPFVVINADDYYGASAFALLAAHFGHSPHPAMVGYRLAATLSPNGAVNRGVCRVDAEGRLVDVREITGISLHDGVLAGTAPDGRREVLAADVVVSLNCWGLRPDLFPDLELGLRRFLARPDANAEYFLPHAIMAHLAARRVPLIVLPSPDPWLGMTYPADRAHVTSAFAALHAAGAYASPLWSR